jgi:NAD(P)-dependent dehydrogenase (short-subunit alcohol dehydrogenase family)
MTRRLENKTALVTGSTSNIGQEIAVAFGREGAHVIASGRGDARGHAVVARIRDAGGKADYVHADLGRSYVVQVAWIPTRTWANDGQGGLVFWLHPTLRRGAGAVR